MSEDSIDFQPIPKEYTQDEQVRHLFRVPINLKDKVCLDLGQNQYIVTNLSATGVAVNVGSCLEFDFGRIIDDVGLLIDDVRLTGLSAKVIHCSVNDSGSFQFGLQWVDMSAENKKTLAQVIDSLKAKALEVKDLSDEHF